MSRTKLEKYNTAHRWWVCKACNHKHDSKPKECTVCGKAEMHYFQSTAECSRHDELLMLKRAGHIQRIDVHPQYPVFSTAHNGESVRVLLYIADFRYWMIGGTEIVEDVKPRHDPKSWDPKFILKKNAVEAVYGIEIQIVARRK